MGIVLKQTLSNTIVSYAGLIVGYINIVILYPTYFSITEFGLVSLLMSISFVYSQISAFGISNTVLKYFPVFKSEDKRHNGFISWILLLMSAGFVVITLLYIIFKPAIDASFVENSPIFLEYFYWIIPLSLFQLVFNVFESLARSIHKTVLSTALRELIFRLLTTLGIILVAMKFLSFDQFVIYFVLIHGLIFVVLFGQIVFSKEFKLFSNVNLFKRDKLKEVINYGLFTLISISSYYIALNLDRIMLGSMVGLEIVGIYQIYIFVGTVIVFPYRALGRIAVPIIADCWKKNDTEKIKMMYKKTSLMLFIISGLIYTGILVNEHNLLALLKKPEFAGTFPIFIIIGLSFLIDSTGGINSDILTTSEKYRVDTLFNVLFLIANVILNFIFIPWFGGIGAAVATTLSFVIFNITKWYYIKHRFNMQPFDSKYIIVILILGVSLTIGYLLPIIENVFLDLTYRSIIVAGVYLTLTISLKISEDINEKFYKVLARVGIKK
ncbi:MAG TPA: polysaccharide biosynthesis C-terminal domain-containing protein [Ignavibacteria bacterium]|nr:polysaccharide biosynthesis C-terminal domain-containing protein [Ignavibacteria bacterium]